MATDRDDTMWDGHGGQSHTRITPLSPNLLPYAMSLNSVVPHTSSTACAISNGDLQHITATTRSGRAEDSRIVAVTINPTVNSLPVELLMQILSHVRMHERKWRQWGWLYLLLVCRRWRDVAVSTAIFWSDVAVQGGSSNSDLDFLKLCLARSGTAQMKVAFSEGSGIDGRLASLLTLLNTHHGRLHTLHLLRLNQLRIQTLPQSVAISYPVLTVLSIGNRCPGGTPRPVQLSAQQFPALRSLTLHGAYVTPESSILPRITTLRIEVFYITRTALALVLSKCRELEHLYIAYSYITSRPQFAPKFYDVPQEERDPLHDHNNSFSSLQTIELVDNKFYPLRRCVSALDHAGILPALARQSFPVEVSFKNMGLDIGEADRRELEAKEKLFRRLGLFSRLPPSSLTSPICAFVWLYADKCALSLEMGHISVSMDYHIMSLAPGPLDSDFDTLCRLLRQIPIAELTIHYIRRMECEYEPKWRDFLNLFPDLQALVVQGPAHRATGAERIVRALQEQHQGDIVDAGRSRFVCPRLRSLLICGFRVPDRKKMQREVEQLVEARRMLDPPIEQAEIEWQGEEVEASEEAESLI
ncbi:hypothetical protein C8Q74DRAFT_1452184 [Fomes fomentarius]|nr:hypothetical protein C8Q74DRAFT_1452184 [Fomes fomentarius]